VSHRTAGKAAAKRKENLLAKAREEYHLRHILRDRIMFSISLIRCEKANDENVIKEL